MSKSKVEIIDETVEYIQKHGRSRSDYRNPFDKKLKKNACSYRAVNAQGKKIGCAVGRVISDEKYSEDLEGMTVESLEQDESIDHLIKPEYHGHSSHFWSDLQSIHDSDHYWDEADHLTPEGKSQVKTLKERYNEA